MVGRSWWVVRAYLRQTLLFRFYIDRDASVEHDHCSTGGDPLMKSTSDSTISKFTNNSRWGGKSFGNHALPYTRVFDTLFLGRPEIVDFGVLVGPGGPENNSKRWGTKCPWKGFPGCRGRPDPKHRKSPVGPQTIH
jgi:hypothetical protein